jgi:hypothetical protein
MYAAVPKSVTVVLLMPWLRTCTDEEWHAWLRRNGYEEGIAEGWWAPLKWVSPGKLNLGKFARRIQEKNRMEKRRVKKLQAKALMPKERIRARARKKKRRVKKLQAEAFARLRKCLRAFARSQMKQSQIHMK